jgi:hypothetical protein
MKSARSIYIPLIVLLVGLFLYRSVYRPIDAYIGPDQEIWDLDYWRASGNVWNHGEDPYNCQVYAKYLNEIDGFNEDCIGNFYTPAAHIIFSLLAMLDKGTSFYLLLSVNIFLIFIVLFLLGKVMAEYIPLNLPEYALLAALLSTGIRTNLKYSQTGLLVTVPILICYLYARRNRQILAGTWLSLVSLKPTSLPLYVLYYFLKRNYKLVITVLVVCLALFVVPLVLTERPVLDSIYNYVGNYRYHNQGADDTSPFKPYSANQYQLSVLVFRIMNTNEGIAPMIAWTLAAALVIYCFFLLQKKDDTPASGLLDFSIVSLATMIFVYHRSYESLLLLLPFLYLYIRAKTIGDPRHEKIWMVVIALLLLAEMAPSDLSVKLITIFPNLADYYLYRLVAPFKVWLSVVTMMILLVIKNQQVRSTSRVS